jgi:hypothetical protein
VIWIIKYNKVKSEGTWVSKIKLEMLNLVIG